MLGVYVDDFKLAGPSTNLDRGWSLIASKIKFGQVTDIGRYLGCQHIMKTVVVQSTFDPRHLWTKETPPKKEKPRLPFDKYANEGGQRAIKFLKYDMADFLKQCVERYLELGAGKITEKLRKVDTPFLDESKPEFDENPETGVQSPQKKGDGSDLSAMTSGVLGDIASAVLMKVLYAARMGDRKSVV